MRFIYDLSVFTISRRQGFGDLPFISTDLTQSDEIVYHDHVDVGLNPIQHAVNDSREHRLH
jgi:hypothetical protein